MEVWYKNSIAKFTNNGVFSWVKGIRKTEVIVNTNGDCIFYGYFSGSTSIESNNFSSFGDLDILIGKYDTNGILS